MRVRIPPLLPNFPSPYPTKIAKYGCVGKVRHPNRKTANEALDLMKEKATSEDQWRLRVYSCGDHFHVGRISLSRTGVAIPNNLAEQLAQLKN